MKENKKTIYSRINQLADSIRAEIQPLIEAREKLLAEPFEDSFFTRDREKGAEVQFIEKYGHEYQVPNKNGFINCGEYFAVTTGTKSPRFQMEAY